MHSFFVFAELESNTTCLPGVGIFILHLTRLNFSNAKEACEVQGAHLALITSEERTNGLSRLVATLGSSSRLHRAYVGLTDIDQEGKFTSVLGIRVRSFTSVNIENLKHKTNFTFIKLLRYYFSYSVFV